MPQREGMRDESPQLGPGAKPPSREAGGLLRDKNCICDVQNVNVNFCFNFCIHFYWTLNTQNRRPVKCNIGTGKWLNGQLRL